MPLEPTPHLSLSASSSFSKCRCSFWPGGAVMAHTQYMLPDWLPAVLGERTRPMVALCTVPPQGAAGQSRAGKGQKGAQPPPPPPPTLLSKERILLPHNGWSRTAQHRCQDCIQ